MFVCLYIDTLYSYFFSFIIKENKKKVKNIKHKHNLFAHTYKKVDARQGRTISAQPTQQGLDKVETIIVIIVFPRKLNINIQLFGLPQNICQILFDKSQSYKRYVWRGGGVRQKQGNPAVLLSGLFRQKLVLFFILRTTTNI